MSSEAAKSRTFLVFAGIGLALFVALAFFLKAEDDPSTASEAPSADQSPTAAPTNAPLGEFLKALPLDPGPQPTTAISDIPRVPVRELDLRTDEEKIAAVRASLTARAVGATARFSVDNIDVKASEAKPYAGSPTPLSTQLEQLARSTLRSGRGLVGNEGAATNLIRRAFDKYVPDGLLDDESLPPTLLRELSTLLAATTATGERRSLITAVQRGSIHIGLVFVAHRGNHDDVAGSLQGAWSKLVDGVMTSLIGRLKAIGRGLDYALWVDWLVVQAPGGSVELKAAASLLPMRTSLPQLAPEEGHALLHTAFLTATERSELGL